MCNSRRLGVVNLAGVQGARAGEHSSFAVLLLLELLTGKATADVVALHMMEPADLFKDVQKFTPLRLFVAQEVGQGARRRGGAMHRVSPAQARPHAGRGAPAGGAQPSLHVTRVTHIQA